MNPIKGNLKPLNDNILVTEMNFEEQVTKNGIVILSDDGKTHGIKPRWCQVYATGPLQEDVKVGDWIFVEHGRWTRGFDLEKEDGEIITLRRVDPEAILLVADEKPNDVYIGHD